MPTCRYSTRDSSVNPKARWSPQRRKFYDFNRFIRLRYGTIQQDTPNRHQIIWIAVQLAGDPMVAMNWVARFAPWLPEKDLRKTKLKRRRYNLGADFIGREAGIPYAVKMGAKLRSLGCVEYTREERAKLTIIRKRANERAKRRAAGATPRAEYEAQCVRREIATLGMSKSAYYRRKAKGTVQQPQDGGTGLRPVYHFSLEKSQTCPTFVPSDGQSGKAGIQGGDFGQVVPMRRGSVGGDDFGTIWTADMRALVRATNSGSVPCR